MLCKPDSGLGTTPRTCYSCFMKNASPAHDSVPTLTELACQTLDLWQDHILKASMDPETIALTGRILSALSSLTPEMPEPDKNARKTQHHGSQGSPDPDTSTKAPPGPPASASAPDDRSLDPGWMLRRITALEERITILERRIASRSKAGPGRLRPTP